MQRALAVVCLLAVAGLAGCASPLPAPARPDAVVSARGTQPGQGLDTRLLSRDSFKVGPQQDDHVPSSQDQVKLHVWWFLPDGKPGPWPTILENSPYNGQNTCQASAALPTCGTPSLAAKYVPKGYAVVLADVRGTGTSEGCMDMMGAKEQKDTYDLVEWIAGRPWSNGMVGMQGVSYVGTTPHEALIENPPHLKAVATTAGVTNQWRNMYQNGVPYQGRFYPLTYEALEGAPPPLDVGRGPEWALNTANGACDQQDMAEHVRPGVYEKGIYDSYWAERNFTIHAKDVTVPLLYSQGFMDRAVNPMEAIYWFNDVQGPKKAFIHQGVHQYAPRDDYFDVELAWFDHYLKGIDNGVDRTPIVEVLTNTDKIRLDDEWPPTDAKHVALYLSEGKLTDAAPADASQVYYAPLVADPVSEDPVGLGVPTVARVGSTLSMPTLLDFAGPRLDADLELAGNAVMHLRASSDQANTYFLCELQDWDGTTLTFVQEGWFNAHLREGFDHSAPLTPGTAYDFTFKFEPRDYVFQAGHQVVVRIKGTDSGVMPFDTPAATNTVLFGAGGSWVDLPVLDHPALFERPSSI